MKGADEFAPLFKTGQYGRLYIVSAEHARGKTFRVFILPEGEKAIPNGDSNGPLNSDAVEVYGITGGQPGWTETYGWLHKGKWQEDFNKLALSQRMAIEAEKMLHEATTEEAEKTHRERIADLLSKY